METPAAVECRRSGLAVGDEDDLAVGASIRSEQLTGVAQRLFDIGAVFHEVSQRHD